MTQLFALRPFYARRKENWTRYFLVGKSKEAMIRAHCVAYYAMSTLTCELRFKRRREENRAF
jgi:hypothetical protein